MSKPKPLPEYPEGTPIAAIALAQLATGKRGSVKVRYSTDLLPTEIILSQELREQIEAELKEKRDAQRDA